MRVLMLPHLSDFHKSESGIRRVVEAYFRYLPEFGVELVRKTARNFDLKAVHAGMTGADCDIAHCHGLYWTADYESPEWEYRTNQNVIASVRHAREVTVPSSWVAETFQRDMRLNPHVIGHGIDWQEWQHKDKEGNKGYVLWNKNRTGDVCDIESVGRLARAFPKRLFLTTFAPDNPTPNIKVTGVIPHGEMKKAVQQAGLYLSTTKETFGIGVLEAMASGIPVLGFNYGGNTDLVQHGITGYLATPGSYEDLERGLNYCFEHKDILGANGREFAKEFTWQIVCKNVADVYKLALQSQPATVSIVIPSYNYADKVGRAIESAIGQTYEYLTDIIIIDDGSDDVDRTKDVVLPYSEKDKRVKYFRQSNSGVAVARNRGINETRSKYIACLDADDAIEPTYLEKLIPHLEADSSLGVVYSALAQVIPDHGIHASNWPGACDFEAQLQRKNQVPTCCVFRRKAWERLGGYKQRYAPRGCGAEDAELWLRFGAYGWGIKQVTKKPLFLYTLGGATTGDRGYQEPDWTYWHPWTKDGQHPFASIAKPNRYSHPVRQYDNPTVSVIIPVGPGHGHEVVNALDSLEGQTFRNWEAIIANDTGETELTDKVLSSYPYVKLYKTKGQLGAGAARNMGVSVARAPFLLFLDADDWLYPDAIQQMLWGWNEQESIVYTDYVGRAIISEELALQLRRDKRLHHYDNSTGEAVIAHQASDFECERAQLQPKYSGNPQMPFYHWCLITCLIPKAWHNEIGGFDESMKTWEDIEYHWRMARAGKCYVRLPKELVVYNFHKGHRRESAKTGQNFKSVVQYVKTKFKEIEPVGCRGCGKSRTVTARTTASVVTPANPKFVSGASAATKQAGKMRDANYVLIRYAHPNKGNHPVYGSITGEFYGYRANGDRFIVHKNDIWDEWGNHIGKYFEPLPKEKPSTLKVSKPKPVRRDLPPPPMMFGGEIVQTGAPEPQMAKEVEQAKVVEPVERLEPEAKQETAANFSPGDVTIAELRESIIILNQSISPFHKKQQLEMLLAQEKEGKNRVTAVRMLEVELSKL